MHFKTKLFATILLLPHLMQAHKENSFIPDDYMNDTDLALNLSLEEAASSAQRYTPTAPSAPDYAEFDDEEEIYFHEPSAPQRNENGELETEPCLANFQKNSLFEGIVIGGGVAVIVALIFKHLC